MRAYLAGEHVFLCLCVCVWTSTTIHNKPRINFHWRASNEGVASSASVFHLYIRSLCPIRRSCFRIIHFYVSMDLITVITPKYIESKNGVWCWDTRGCKKQSTVLHLNMFATHVPDFLTGQHFLFPPVSVDPENFADLTVVLVID